MVVRFKQTNVVRATKDDNLTFVFYRNFFQVYIITYN